MVRKPSTGLEYISCWKILEDVILIPVELSDRVMLRERLQPLPVHSRSHKSPAALTMPITTANGNVTRIRTQKAVVEAAFFVDESLYKHVEKVFPNDTKRQVTIFALTLINQLQVVYEQESLGGLVSITLTYFEIMYPQAHVSLWIPQETFEMFMEALPCISNIYHIMETATQLQEKIPANHDYDYYLTSFCIYQQARRNTKDSNYSQWDYAVLISGNYCLIN